LNPQPISHEGLAIAALFASLVISWLVYKHNLKAARLSDSNALHVNALHFFADVVASVGIMFGLPSGRTARRP
jgi:divalent metal cation (Fe/Co/Zn/Cd) transporter